MKSLILADSGFNLWHPEGQPQPTARGSLLSIRDYRAHAGRMTDFAPRRAA